MLFSITVNNKKIMAAKGETILSALNRNGIIIPTLCRLKDFTPTGACRLCVVEVDGRDRLVTACSEPVEEWMIIKTHSPRVIRTRKTIVELLLSKHPDECLYCVRNLNCELQKLAAELNIRERRIRGRKVKPRLDQSGHSLVREQSKCVMCGRCVRVCEEVATVTAIDFINRAQKTRIGTAMDLDFNFTSCINCGQCVNVCPTGALHEKHNLNEVQDFLSNPGYIKVIQYSPVVPMAVAEELKIKPSKDFDRILNGILKKIGFSKIFLTGSGTDILIEELAGEVSERMNDQNSAPLFISACGAWVKYAEQALPDELQNLSVLKPPQNITGAYVKSVLAGRMGLKPQQIYSVSVTPCTAMKFEAKRDGMMVKGIYDVDSVLTVRELARLIQLYGIDASGTEGEYADDPMLQRSAMAALAEISGGLTEAVVRSVISKITGHDPGHKEFKSILTGGSFREATYKAGEKTLSVAVVDGLTGIEKLKEAIVSGKKYNLVEVMVCPGGCINGGGLPVGRTKEELRNRVKQIVAAEETAVIQMPYTSPFVMSFYEKDVKSEPSLSERKILYTCFAARDVLL